MPHTVQLATLSTHGRVGVPSRPPRLHQPISNGNPVLPVKSRLWMLARTFSPRVHLLRPPCESRRDGQLPPGRPVILCKCTPPRGAEGATVTQPANVRALTCLYEGVLIRVIQLQQYRVQKPIQKSLRTNTNGHSFRLS